MNSQYSQYQSQEKENKPQEDRYKKPFIIAASLCVVMALSALLSASGFSFASAQQKIKQALKKDTTSSTSFFIDDQPVKTMDEYNADGKTIGTVAFAEIEKEDISALSYKELKLASHQIAELTQTYKWDYLTLAFPDGTGIVCPAECGLDGAYYGEIEDDTENIGDDYQLVMDMGSYYTLTADKDDNSPAVDSASSHGINGLNQ